MNLLTRSSLTLACAAFVSGCAVPPRFERVPERSDPEVVAEQPPARTVRVGVLPYEGPFVYRHQAVVRALRSHRGVEAVQTDYQVESGLRVDYMVQLSYQSSADARWYNLLTCFPGFVVFAPTWAQLHWDYVVGTTAGVTRYPSGSFVGSYSRRDVYDAAGLPLPYGVGAYLGWMGVIFAPIVASPLITGIVAADADWEAQELDPWFARNTERREYAQLVANMVAAAIDTDLRQP